MGVTSKSGDSHIFPYFQFKSTRIEQNNVERYIIVIRKYIKLQNNGNKINGCSFEQVVNTSIEFVIGI